jgi:hypothetical protein
MIKSRLMEWEGHVERKGRIGVHIGNFGAKIRRKETTRPGIILKWIIER